MCGASYEVTVWDLGQKDSGSISCECCGTKLREWKKEARDYSISRIIRRGSIHVNYEDWPAYIGKRITIEINHETFVGIVKGLSDSIIATGPDTVVRPWVLETEKEDIHFIPNDSWRICLS